MKLLKNSTSRSNSQFGQNCNTEYTITCIKMDIIGFIEKLSGRKEFSILPGISVVREIKESDPKTIDIISEISRSFPNDADKRLDGYIITKLGNFLQSLSLRFKLSDNSEIEDAKSEFAGRRSNKIGKKGGLEAIIAAGMMMKGMLFTIAMGALAALAGKALMTGLMALMLSAIVGLKALTSGGHKSTTYEIVAKPVHQVSHSHSVSHEDFHGGHGHSGHGGHGYSGYGRSFNIVLPDHLKDPNIK
ncbi:uncharacterized protein LOC129613174 [Condylostylus longicornis]|uniref:uncharacterized protein LOC129613174 n=1 Tax=Condylostylus longicornis TaxID=2530218 RepID=UPI00244D9A4E|nr:uncharacterized protein LOC129613174 [Condylostylus longicornis]